MSRDANDIAREDGVDAVRDAWDAPRLSSGGEAEPVDGLPPLAVITATSLAGKAVPERQWIVPDLIPDRNVTDLSGDGGTGKSLLALQLCVAMPTATDWIGFMPVPGRALYVSMEDEVDEVHRRLGDIVAASGERFALGDLDDLHIIDLAVRNDTELAIAQNGRLQMTDLFRRLEEAVRTLRPKLMVLDTRADAYGASEIDRAQVRAFVRALRRLCMEYDMAILLLSHPSVAGMASGTGQSGSTGWGNSVRSRLTLERPKVDGGEVDPLVRNFVGKKENYGPMPATVTLRWTKGVFRPETGGLAGLDRIAQEQAVEDRFISLLREFDTQGRTVNDKAGPRYAPAAFAKADGSISKLHFAAAQERLFKAGKLKVEPFGPPSRGTKKIAEVVS